jgi:hypothetical protein
MKYWLKDLDNKTFSPVIDGILWPGAYVIAAPCELVIGDFFRDGTNWKIKLKNKA